MDAPKHLMLAGAAKADIQAKMHAFHAAIMRGDHTEAEKIRAEAHAMLDAGLDHYAAAVKALQALSEG